VYIASRTATKVEEAIKALVEEQPALSPLLHHLQLDLASLKSCDAAATTFKTKETRLDGIVANAGIMAVPYELTEDGVETQFQTNHLGHWLFALKLRDLMAKTGEARGSPARLVNLSSFAHNFVSPSPSLDPRTVNTSWEQILTPSMTQITVYPFAKPEFDSLTKVNRSFDPLGESQISSATTRRHTTDHCTRRIHPILTGQALCDPLLPRVEQAVEPSRPFALCSPWIRREYYIVLS
jgi:NAD(P)-dependent dehydrogenase (short-subunit alcohol dehydrogenase family)